MYKIYCRDHLLILGKPEDGLGMVRVDVKKKKAFHGFVKAWLSHENSEDTLVYGYEEEKLFQQFCQIVKYIEAAGGVVRNQQNQVLWIKRAGIWDLPKGKIDKNEKVEDCALREVEEETGVQELRISEDLKPSYHIYWHNKKWYLKKTYWFFMETFFDEDLEPQLEEEITEARWMSVDECRQAFEQTYRSLRESIGEEICAYFKNLA